MARSGTALAYTLCVNAKNQNRTNLKVAAMLVIGLVSLWSVGPVSAQTVASATTESGSGKSWTKKMFGRQEWSEIARTYESPREICRLVESNIRYTTEKSDLWTESSETWTRGRGDCEDFAILIQDLCKLSGMDTKVHLYFPAAGGREGHAILVGEWNGKIWFSSNGSYEEVKSEKDVRNRIARMLSCKEKQLWGMKLTERDVAKYVESTPARAVAAGAR